MAMTRQALRELVAERLYAGYEIVLCTATGGTNSTIVDTALIQGMFEENDYIGAYVYISSGGAAPEDESSKIVAFDRATGTLTVSPAWSGATVVVNTDTYEIHYDLHPERMNDGLVWAVEVGTNGALTAPVTDSTSTTFEAGVVVEGALAYCKRAIANQTRSRDPASIRTDEEKLELFRQALEHEANWLEGCRTAGFSPWVGDEGLFKTAETPRTVEPPEGARQ